MPGSPAIKITAPGTTPPPSTRSYSLKPVETRADCFTDSSVVARNKSPTLAATTGVERLVLLAPRVTRASWNSSMVPHSPQFGQRPNHFAPFHPHSEQTN